MQQTHLQNSERIIRMKQYAVEITDEALADMEQLYNYIAYNLLSPEKDNYSVFFVIKEDRVIVTDVLYSASDINSRLKG